jgi:hypothetical protein
MTVSLVSHPSQYSLSPPFKHIHPDINPQTFLFYSMACKAASNTLKKRVWQEEKAGCMALALKIYHEEHQQIDSKERLGLQKICKNAQKEYLAQTGIVVPVPNHNTLNNLAKGRTLPKAQVNAERGWLSEEEAETVIAYVIECAEVGFGLDHCRLKEHVDEIC